MRILIHNGPIFVDDVFVSGHTLVLADGKVAALATSPVEAQPGDQLLDASGTFVVPGFIDVHVHGGAGHDVMDATPEALHGMARFFAAHGTTSYYPTTMSAAPEAIARALATVAACPQDGDSAQHLGVHVEGPYLNPEYRGAQPRAQLRLPDPVEYGAWLERDVVRLVTLAPEVTGASKLLDALCDAGVEIALGHTGASYQAAGEAFERGARQTTHTFNGMRALHHREPGVLGAALTDGRVYTQLIADGVHVHPGAVRLLLRAKGTRRVLLITDAMRAAGLEDGSYTLGGEAVTVQAGVARTAEGSLAGSTLTMDRALRNVMAFAGLTLEQALPMATSVPAEAMGIAPHKGSLVPGADADVVLLDRDQQVVLTLVQGCPAYARESAVTGG